MVVLQVPISCLQWEHRLPLILHEIREADADIICLQELNHFGEVSDGQTQLQATDTATDMTSTAPHFVVEAHQGGRRATVR